MEIGVTGGIGSGKSLVCKIFSLLGVPIYDADKRAKWLNNNDDAIRQAIVKRFGEKAYNEKGLDRDYIADIVFNDPKKLDELNAIVHPAVGKDYDHWVKQHSESTYLIKEAALMFESGADKRLFKIINISAPENLRVERVQQRDPFRSEKEIRSIIKRQLSEGERQQRADYNIYNDEQQMLIPQVLKLHQTLLNFI